MYREHSLRGTKVILGEETNSIVKKSAFPLRKIHNLFGKSVTIFFSGRYSTNFNKNPQQTLEKIREVATTLRGKNGTKTENLQCKVNTEHFLVLLNICPLLCTYTARNNG